MSNHENSKEIREDIDETRRDMGRKIDAIQNQLSPEHLKAKAQDVVNDVATSTADSVSAYVQNNMGDISHTVAGALKRNPLPTALVGLGLGWLLIESLGDDKSTSARYPVTRYRPSMAQHWSAEDEQAYHNANYQRTPTQAYGSSVYAENESEQGIVSQVKETVSNAADSVQQKADEWMHRTQEQVENATTTAQRVSDEARLQGHLAAMDAQDQVSDWQQQGRSFAHQAGRSTQRQANQAAEYTSHIAGEAQGYAQDTARQVGSYVHDVSDQAQHYAQQARRQAYSRGEQVVETVEENPLTFGVISLAVGAAIGLLLPQTRREKQWVGPYRDQVTDTARVAATDVADHVQEAVEEIRPEIERSAQKIATDLQETGKTVANDLKQTGDLAKQQAQKVGTHAKEVVSEKSKDAQSDVKERVKETTDSR